jgi:hypothetical protein
VTRRELELWFWGLVAGLLLWPFAAIVVGVIFQFTGGSFCGVQS